MVGGLNFQIEHHLFPRVSHVHYPAISKIVQEACQKYKLNYNYYPSMLQAVVSHVKTMKRLGKKDWRFPAPVVESYFTQRGKEAKPQSI